FLRGGAVPGHRAHPHLAAFPLPRRTGRPRRPGRGPLRDQSARAGHAPVLLPVEQHAGRRAAPLCRRRDAAPAGRARGPGAAPAPGREGRALAENFGGQWLQTRALESHTPDRAKFPEFTDYTRLSMKKETDLFFGHILREDRSILDFIDANYTLLNQRLAEFYKIPGVKGHEFRKV